jgi:hypothetical protein
MLALGACTLALGCGGGESESETADRDGCGQPSGVPGEIVIIQPMSCDEAIGVAMDYYESGAAPALWRSGNRSRGWQCNGDLPRELEPALVQCHSYSTAPAAQNTLGRLFQIHPVE